MLVLSTECSVLGVYTAKETNSKVNGKLQDTEFRICGGLPNTSCCTNCMDSVATRERWHEQNFALIRGPNAFILQKYLGIIRKTHVSQNCGYVS